MAEHLCLKWNNHSTAFLNGISNIQTKERFCDATIACQGKYFPVHRIILSTCSNYFDEIFERMQSPHPYIVFKDIDSCEMELLLNYMYQGEVNVAQEKLPVLLKAAEALQIKGIAVPDDLPSTKEPLSKRRRRLSTADNSQSKRRIEENANSNNGSSPSESMERTNESTNSRLNSYDPLEKDEELTRIIKEEQVDSEISESHIKQEDEFVNFPIVDNSSSYIEKEQPHNVDIPFEVQSPSWSGLANENLSLTPEEIAGNDQYIPSVINPEGMGSNHDVNMSGVMKCDSYNLSNRSAKGRGALPISRKPYSSFHKCSFCDYRSYYSTNVKKHVMCKHTGERPFACTVCNKRFRTKENVQIHMRTHTGERPFQCVRCCKQFAQKSSLKMHLFKKHNLGY